MNEETIDVFFSYSHKDKALLTECKEHLSSLKREGLISMWDDGEIPASGKWEPTIFEKLEKSDIVILLISSSFIASDFCYKKEMMRAIELHESRQSYLIPVIVRACDWTNTEFSKYQALPSLGKAITSWENQDEAWLDVVKGIRFTIENVIAYKKLLVPNIVGKPELTSEGHYVLQPGDPFIDDDSQEKEKIFLRGSSQKIILSGNKSASTPAYLEKELLKFLKSWSKWSFNVPRIMNWGGRQAGFGVFANADKTKLKKTLNQLDSQGRVEKSQSSSGSDMYKIV